MLTVSELRELAKKKEIKGYSKMKKEELLESLR
ncbi:MAG: Rho termination factor N-terminal domain-containing protein [bacterium]|nr:Rho termination factor N-terminal domain-containing protein [bacterium]